MDNLLGKSKAIDYVKGSLLRLFMENRTVPLNRDQRRMLKVFLENEADPDEMNTEKGVKTTALMYASMSGQSKAVKILLTYKADPNKQNKLYDTALTLACAGLQHPPPPGHPRRRKECFKCVEHILKNRAEPHFVNREGYTALSYAAQNEHLQVVRLLLESGAQQMQWENRNNTPLAIIKEKDQSKDVVKKLRQVLEHWLELEKEEIEDRRREKELRARAVEKQEQMRKNPETWEEKCARKKREKAQARIATEVENSINRSKQFAIKFQNDGDKETKLSTAKRRARGAGKSAMQKFQEGFWLKRKKMEYECLPGGPPKPKPRKAPNASKATEQMRTVRITNNEKPKRKQSDPLRPPLLTSPKSSPFQKNPHSLEYMQEQIEKKDAVDEKAVVSRLLMDKPRWQQAYESLEMKMPRKELACTLPAVT